MNIDSIEIDGDALRRLLRRLRMSVQELAPLIGKHPQTIYRLQQGRGDASMEFLDALAEVAGRESVANILVRPADREDFLNAIAPTSSTTPSL
jgi:predicted transcriptional regulator